MLQRTLIATVLLGVLLLYSTLPVAAHSSVQSKATSPRIALTGIHQTSCFNSHTLYIGGDQGDNCFVGTGYLGFRVTHLYAIISSVNGWLRMYPSGSTSGFTFNFGSHTYITSPTWPADGNHDITQICIC